MKQEIEAAMVSRPEPGGGCVASAASPHRPGLFISNSFPGLLPTQGMTLPLALQEPWRSFLQSPLFDP